VLALGGLVSFFARAAIEIVNEPAGDFPAGLVGVIAISLGAIVVGVAAIARVVEAVLKFREESFRRRLLVIDVVCFVVGGTLTVVMTDQRGEIPGLRLLAACAWAGSAIGIAGLWLARRSRLRSDMT
jgi:hypothetical protein